MFENDGSVWVDDMLHNLRYNGVNFSDEEWNEIDQASDLHRSSESHKQEYRVEYHRAVLRLARLVKLHCDQNASN